MAFQLVAYAKSVLSSGTLQALAPVPDPTVSINDNDVSVPAQYNQLIRAAASCPGTVSRAQVQSPSLRSLYFPDISPVVSGAGSFSNPGGTDRYDVNPLQLITNEGLEFWSDGGGNGTTAQYAYGLLLLSDGPVVPAQGKVIPIHGSLSAVAAVDAWNSSPMVLDQTLPVGNYDVVGLRISAAGLVAARMIFIGQSATTRAGVAAQNSLQDVGLPEQRKGALGVFGTFPSTNPPSIEVLGGTSTVQNFIIDLIKR